jgi:probable F420-dependent oxidoreductase
MKIGLIPAAGGAIHSSGGYVADYVGAAEAHGFDSVWLGEHPALPVASAQDYPGRKEGLPAPSALPLPDPLDWLAFAAARTTTLLLGTAILILPLHHPVVLAKRISTLDQLSDGRVRLGIGVGWNQQEFAACGAEWSGRGRRTDEMIGALRNLWRDEHASFEGELVRFEPVFSSPKPVNRSVPILVGANSAVGARRAGRLGDGFMPFEREHARLVELIDIMRHAAEEAGRDPYSVEITALGSTRPERIDAIRDLGVHRMLLFEADPAAIPRLADRLGDVG